MSYQKTIEIAVILIKAKEGMNNDESGEVMIFTRKWALITQRGHSSYVHNIEKVQL